ncbi:MAG: hypothetical protein E6R03_10800 [Hyphomicrobiaceae bacterium]|nr:MAG: hypothetical protein E6R03_10800 [Hyphomicrobiaceae bacterium]
MRERKIEQIATRLALIHSEVSEALECIRDKNFDPDGLMLYVSSRSIPPSPNMYAKPEGLASELADIIIRVLDLASALKIDIGAALVAKARYNATRPHKHGGKAI